MPRHVFGSIFNEEKIEILYVSKGEIAGSIARSSFILHSQDVQNLCETNFMLIFSPTEIRSSHFSLARSLFVRSERDDGREHPDL